MFLYILYRCVTYLLKNKSIEVKMTNHNGSNITHWKLERFPAWRANVSPLKMKSFSSIIIDLSGSHETGVWWAELNFSTYL